MGTKGAPLVKDREFFVTLGRARATIRM